jgi:GT2 family glycosyltransferase
MPDRTIVSVVIGSYNRLEFLKPTVESVRRELAEVEHEIIVVDGGSSDGSEKWLLAQKDVITIVQHNRGRWRGEPIQRKSWGYFMNLGFRAAHGRYICMLSDDCLVIPGAIRNGIAVFEAKLQAGEKVGAVAFYWRDWQGKVNYRVGLTWGNKMFVNHGLYLNEALTEIGHADEDRYFFYHADGDICLRLAEADYACVDSPASYIEHRKHVNVKLKTANRQHAIQDWAAYTKLWAHLGEPKVAWIEKAFIDPHRTAETWWPSAQQPLIGRLKSLRTAKPAEAHRPSRARRTIATAAAVSALFLIFGVVPEALGDWPYNPFGKDSRAQNERHHR